MVSYGDLRDWDPAGLSSASKDLRADLKTLEKAKDEVAARAVPDSWAGLARLFAEIRQQWLVSSMETHLEGVRPFERAIFTAHGQVVSIKSLVVDIDHDARSQDFEIGRDGSVSDVSPPRTFPSERAAEAYSEGRVTLRDAIAQRVQSVVDEAYDVDSAIVHARPDGAFSSEGPQGVVDPEVERRWAEMSDEERQRVLEDVAEDLAAQSGVEDFEVRVEDLEDQDGDGVDDDPDTDSRGSWSEDDRVLRIDVNDLDDPETINTIGHEVRHAAQNQAVRDLEEDDFVPPPGATREDVEDWRDNFDDYKTPEDDGFEEYENQPVERDAREAGDDFIDDFTGEDLERHREEAG